MIACKLQTTCIISVIFEEVVFFSSIFIFLRDIVVCHVLRCTIFFGEIFKSKLLQLQWRDL